MKKLLINISFITLTGSLFAMDDTTRDAGRVNTAEYKTLESNYLLYIANENIAANYKNLRKKYSSADKWWRKQHKTGSLEVNNKFAKRMDSFKNFAFLMDKGKQKFDAKETFEEMPEGKKGMLIRLTTRLFNKHDIASHYKKSEYVYEIITGLDAIKEYLEQEHNEAKNTEDRILFDLLEKIFDDI